MAWEEVTIGACRLIRGDCREVLPTITGLGAIVTDPPYASAHTVTYDYTPTLLASFEQYLCRQLIFWTTTQPFPLSFTARHLWHKQTGSYAQREYIYERHGTTETHTFSYQKIKNSIDAIMNRDVLTPHPSQKPIRLCRALFTTCAITERPIIDACMGSGTIGVVCHERGQPFVGIEKEARWFDLACRRIEQVYAQLDLFTPLPWTDATQQPLFATG